MNNAKITQKGHFARGRKLRAALLAYFNYLSTNLKVCSVDEDLEPPEQLSAPFSTHTNLEFVLFMLFIYFFL